MPYSALQICLVGCRPTLNLYAQQNLNKFLYSLILILLYRHFWFLNKISRWLIKNGHWVLLVLSLKPQETGDVGQTFNFQCFIYKFGQSSDCFSTLCSHPKLFYLIIPWNNQCNMIFTSHTVALSHSQRCQRFLKVFNCFYFNIPMPETWK